MMKKHVSCSGRIGAGVGPDDPIEAEHRLDRVALEPLVEDVAGRAGEELHEIALPFEPERAQAISDLGGIGEGGEIGGDPMSGREVRRRLERERPQNVGQALEPRLIRREPPGVAGGEFRHLGLGPAGTGLQITPVGQGQEVRQRALDDPEAMGGEIEVADDLRVEERDGVGGDRIAEAGMEFLGDRRAADLRRAARAP